MLLLLHLQLLVFSSSALWAFPFLASEVDIPIPAAIPRRF